MPRIARNPRNFHVDIVDSEKSEEEKESAKQSLLKSIAYYEYSSSEILVHLKNAKDVQIKFDFIETALLSQKGRLADLVDLRTWKQSSGSRCDIIVLKDCYGE